MPQSSTIPVDNSDNVLVDVAASSAPVTVTGSLGTFSVNNPAYLGVYSAAIVDSPGTVAANNYISLFNPSGSGVTIVGLSLTVSNYTLNTVNSGQSLQVFRTTAQSGGTLIAASAVNRADTNSPNPQSVVRVANPTVTTTGNVLVGFPPSLGTGAQAPSTTAIPAVPVLCHQGQGLVFTVPVGNAMEVWDLLIVWAEIVGS